MSLTVRRLAPTAVVAAALFALTACGGGSSTNATDPGTGTGAGTQQFGTGGGPQGRQFPGASGTIAAIAGKTLQVQNQLTGQVGVTYTGTTSISADVKSSLAGVKVGSCVVVTSDSSASASADAGPVAASAVRISPKTGDSCGFGGFGGGPGGPSGRPSFAPSDRPSDLPSDLPSGAPGDGTRRIGFGVIGEVTKVANDGFTVAATQLPTDGGASPTTSPKTVTVTGATTYTTTQKATPAVLKVGKCVQATGKSDDTGAVTATSMTVSDPVDGQCTGGFMMRGPQ